MMAGLMRSYPRINPVFVGYLLVISQVIVKQLNITMLDTKSFNEDLHFLAFAQGPLMLILLQTHFNQRHKKSI